MASLRSGFFFVGIVSIFLVPACVIKKLSSEPGNPKWGMDVIWHGHSCFTLRDSVGRTLVMDPFDDTVGYGKLDLLADALLISHNHFDHNYRRAVRTHHKDLDLVQSTGTVTVAAGLQVTGLPSSHDHETGEINGPNNIYIFVFGGLRCVFLGDLGSPQLDEFQLKMIGKVDVLFVPVGGKVTLDGEEAKKVIETLMPTTVFPMHFGNIRFFPLDPIDKFTNLFPPEQVKIINDSHVRIKEADLTDKPVVYILNSTSKN